MEPSSSSGLHLHHQRRDLDLKSGDRDAGRASRRVVASPFDAARAVVYCKERRGSARRGARRVVLQQGLNRFVVATDELIARDVGGLETNASRWMFGAAVGAGDQTAYKGTLEFT